MNTAETQKLIATLKHIRLQVLETVTMYLQQINNPIYGAFAGVRAIDNANYIKELDEMIAQLEQVKS